MNIVTIGNPSLTVSASWDQPSGHAASDWQLNLYQADGVTLIQQIGGSFGSPLPSGTTQDYSYPLLPLDNNTTAFLTISFKDAVSAVWSESPPWELITSWVPPDPPTNLTYTSDTLNGIGRLAWTNSTGTSQLRVEMQQVSPSGALGPNEVVWQGNVRDHIGIETQTCRRDYLFRVTALSAAGIPSTPATVSGRLQFVGQRLGVWLKSLDGSKRVALGFPSDMTTTKFTTIDDIVGVVTLGSKYESTAEGITDFETATQQWWLPAIFRGGAAVIFGHDTRLLLHALKAAGQPLWYTDPRGRSIPVKLRTFWDQDDAGGHIWVGFELRQTRYDGPLPIDLSSVQTAPMSVALS